MKPTILVVGLLPGQVNRVNRDCAQVANLKFGSGRHNSEVRGQADHCILMLKFVDHGHSKKAFNQFPRDRVHFSRGGLNELVSTINGIASGAVTHGVRHP